MRQLDYQPVSEVDRLWQRTLLVAVVVAGVLLAANWAGESRPVPAAPARPVVAAVQSAPSPAQAAPPPPIDLMKVYREQLSPLLDQYEARNHAAVQRAVAAFDERMKMHRAGVRPFARDITSWGTRFGVIGRYSGDLWSRAVDSQPRQSAVKAYVNGKFRQHVLSENALQQDVRSVLEQFDQDMNASRNQLYADVSLSLAKLKIDQPRVRTDLDRFEQDVQLQATRMAGSAAGDTIVSGLVSVAGGWVATDVAQGIATRVVTQVITQLGSTMAVEGVEAGGATAGGSAAGAGAGSFGGPIGTVVGLCAGLVIGAGVDWWMTDRFQAKISDQCDRFLDNVESRLLDGTARAPGLRQALLQTADLTGGIQRQAVLKALKEKQT